MKLFNSIHSASIDTSIQRETALTIGDFDGCHLGHQALLKKVVGISKQQSCAAGALTFEPSPKVFFSRYQENSRIFRSQDKIAAFRMGHLNFAIIQDFNQDFASLDYKSFFTDILMEKLHVKHLVLGDNFRFGKGRLGNIDLLTELCEQNSMQLHTLKAEKLQGQRISSTSIRNSIIDGNMQLAAAYLGRPYFVAGKVAHGRKKGRTIGFPTANIVNHDQILPARGVYAGLCVLEPRAHARDFLDQDLISCVINVGTRPTFNTDGNTVIEAHLLEFDSRSELYGKELQLFFLEKIRMEQKFASQQELMSQIGNDCIDALAKIQSFFRNC